MPSLAPQESSLSKQLDEKTLTVEGELREIQDLLSIFTQPHPPQGVGVATPAESSQEKPYQAPEESPSVFTMLPWSFNVSTMLPQSSRQPIHVQAGNSRSTPCTSISAPPCSGVLVSSVVEESPLVGSGGTQTGVGVSGASVEVSGTGGVNKDVES